MGMDEVRYYPRVNFPYIFGEKRGIAGTPPAHQVNAVVFAFERGSFKFRRSLGKQAQELRYFPDVGISKSVFHFLQPFPNPPIRGDLGPPGLMREVN